MGQTNRWSAGSNVTRNESSGRRLTAVPLPNRIIKGRPYRRLLDLLGIGGIGPAKFRSLKPLVRIETAEPAERATPATP